MVCCQKVIAASQSLRAFLAKRCLNGDYHFVCALLFSVAWPGGAVLCGEIGVCGLGFALEWSFVAFEKWGGVVAGLLRDWRVVIRLD